MMDPVRVEKSGLIICEGLTDENFLNHLLKYLGVSDKLQVCHPTKNAEDRENGGKTNFGSFVDILMLNEGFYDVLRSIVFIIDKDDDPEAAFSDLVGQLEQIKGLPVPKAPSTEAKLEGFPSICVWLIPTTGNGNLETMCLEAAYAKWPLKAALDSFVAQVPAAAWSLGKQSKMRMQTVLASTNSKQPDAGFGVHWKQKTKFLIPVNDSAFSDLSTLIRDFYNKL